MCFNITNRNSVFILQTSEALLAQNLNPRVSPFGISQHFTVEKSSYLWKVQLHPKVGCMKQVMQEALLLCKEQLFDPHAGEKRKRKGSRSDKLASSDNWRCLHSSFSLLHKCLISFQWLIMAGLNLYSPSSGVLEAFWSSPATVAMARKHLHYDLFSFCHVETYFLIFGSTILIILNV